MKTFEINVYGLVQGVGFRYFTKQLADKLHIHGTVQNKMDASVRIIAQGEEQNLERFIERVKLSPAPAGRVRKVEIIEIKETSLYSQFSIII